VLLLCAVTYHGSQKKQRVSDSDCEDGSGCDQNDKPLQLLDTIIATNRVYMLVGDVQKAVAAITAQLGDLQTVVGRLDVRVAPPTPRAANAPYSAAK
jgi:hypothetical protein